MNRVSQAPAASTLRKRLRAEIDRRRWQPGEQLPSYGAIADLLGSSPRTVMKAVNALEREGVLTRLSPRKIAVAAPRKADHEDLPIGIISLRGHIFEDMAHDLVKRLYDRQLQSLLIDPLGDSDIEEERWFARFFSSRYRSLIIRDNHPTRVDLFTRYRDHFDQLILIEAPFNRWPTPHYGIYVDRAFLMQDALEQRAAAGAARLHVLIGGPSPGAMHLRDQLATGLERFQADHPQVEVTRTVPYDLLDDPERSQRWVAGIRPGDGIFSYSDYFIVKAQEWLHAQGADLARYHFLGSGNTPWSQNGVYRFASYDYRTEDMIEQILDWIDHPGEPVVRRLRPRLVRPDLLFASTPNSLAGARV